MNERILNCCKFTTGTEERSWEPIRAEAPVGGRHLLVAPPTEAEAAPMEHQGVGPCELSGVLGVLARLGLHCQTHRAAHLLVGLLIFSSHFFWD